MKPFFATALASIILTAPLAAEDKNITHITHYRPQAYEDNNLPFSAAVKVGNLLFLAGQVGTKPGTDELVAGGIGPETRQTMENIKMTVEKYGGSMDKIVKCTVFLADINEWVAMNEVYVTFFKPDQLPARSAFGAAGLALGARTEIECIAALD
jgi:2-iminobutanoate/2-iminopropanoate deaminase